MARMRLEYDEARKKIQSIQHQLADLEEKVTPGQVESDKDRYITLHSEFFGFVLNLEKHGAREVGTLKT